MARLNVFKMEKSEKAGSPHKEAVAKYSTFTSEGEKYFQIDMYGSKEREKPGSISQTIQLNKDDAIRLIALLQKAFDL